MRPLLLRNGFMFLEFERWHQSISHGYAVRLSTLSSLQLNDSNGHAGDFQYGVYAPSPYVKLAVGMSPWWPTTISRNQDWIINQSIEAKHAFSSRLQRLHVLVQYVYVLVDYYLNLKTSQSTVYRTLPSLATRTWKDSYQLYNNNKEDFQPNVNM
jgi:hypothetical protein